MIDYISEKQLSITEFSTPFETSLREHNRWAELNKIVPWDTFASIYMQLMGAETGRPGISPRISTVIPLPLYFYLYGQGQRQSSRQVNAQSF